MFVKTSVTLVAALSLLASVDAKRQVLQERGTRCNGDNLLNRFRGAKNSDAAISFCQTFINSVTYSVVTVSTDEAHISSPVTTHSNAYPTALLTTSYDDSRLSSACSCLTPAVVTAVVTEYVASSTSATSDDSVTTTTDDASTITEDPSATTTAEPTGTIVDDSSNTTTAVPSATSTDTVATTTDDASTTTTDEPTTSTIVDDSSNTTTDAPSATSTDDAATTTDESATTTEEPSATSTDDAATSTDDSSTTTTDAATTTTDAPAGPTSLGCYVEGPGGRALKYLILADDALTVESCAAACTDYAFYGVEYGRECWCDSAIERTAFVSPDSSVCNMACKGDATETCGGSGTINIYGAAPGDSSPPPTEGLYDYAGCFAEPAGARALPQLYASTQMTVELCHLDCSLAGFAYAGLEYGVECWCGNAIAELVELDTGSCGVACPGNAEETCGGNNALQLYTLASSN